MVDGVKLVVEINLIEHVPRETRTMTNSSGCNAIHFLPSIATGILGGELCLLA